MDSTQRGYLVLADISGYTSFVAQTELEHAQAILTELLELVIERFNTRLTISKLEGDAVFAYAAGASIERGESLLELIEVTYVAFRDRRDVAYGRTTCTCRACQAIPTLDLKFLLHYGEYFIQNIAGTRELVGSDVNLIHRLLKNRVSEITGWRGYALFSGPGLERLNIRPEGLFEQIEAYEHLGQVQTYSLNMHTRYQEITTRRHIVIERSEAHRILEFDYSTPREVIWEWFNQPSKRSQWMHSQLIPIIQAGGRSGTGARNHCVHGKDQVVVEDILDHHPFDYFTVSHSPRGLSASMWMTFTFSPTPSGTHLTITCKMKTPNMPGWMEKLFCKVVIRFQVLRMWRLDEIDQLVEAAGNAPVESKGYSSFNA
jgi:uncharacterized protein YndB with AHSA1/START domain